MILLINIEYFSHLSKLSYPILKDRHVDSYLKRKEGRKGGGVEGRKDWREKGRERKYYPKVIKTGFSLFVEFN